MSTPTLLDRAEQNASANGHDNAVAVTGIDQVASSNKLVDLIQAVVANPNVSVEKIEALWRMQMEAEDRRAEAVFEAALIAAQDDVQALPWDKLNLTNQGRYVSYPKMEKMLKPIRIRHGFTLTYDTEPGPTPEVAIFCGDLVHKGGHRRRYRLPMPIDPAGPKGGGVMTKTQAVGSGVSYSMRNLNKMIWNVPILVDAEDIDGNTPEEFITKAQGDDLQKLLVEANFERSRLLKYVSNKAKADVASISEIPARLYDDAVAAINKARTQPAQKGGK